MITDYHPEETILLDDERLIGLAHRDILHHWRNEFTMNNAAYKAGWYYHDEIGDIAGPYSSPQEANAAAEAYIRYLNGDNTMDAYEAGQKADELINAEVARQDKMWGVANERTDSSKGQLFRAGLAQQLALYERMIGNANAFAVPPAVYPRDWSGFRDYGSDIANLAVAAAFIRQEIKRKIAAGEDTTRTSRNPETQPYTMDQPNEITA